MPASDLIRPCIKDGIFAPTMEQRLTYKDWLHVHGKSCARLAARHTFLVDDYHVRLFPNVFITFEITCEPEHA